MCYKQRHIVALRINTQNTENIIHYLWAHLQAYKQKVLTEE